MLYNKSDTPFYKAAHRMRGNIRPILQELDTLVSPHPAFSPLEAATSGAPEGLPNDMSTGVPDQTSGTASDPLKSDETDLQRRKQQSVGNLEPDMSLLELLEDSDALDISYILHAPPLESLISQELGVLKPPPPPPPRVRTRIKIKVPAAQREAQRRARNRKRDAAAALESQEDIPESSEGKAVADGVLLTVPAPQLKRARPSANAHSFEPLVVESVDQQQSFKMFEQGWILPPTQRRGGRAPIERHALPPPPLRKRPRTEKSRLSSFSTPTSESQTAQDTDNSAYRSSMFDRSSLPSSSIPDARPSEPVVSSSSLASVSTVVLLTSLPRLNSGWTQGDNISAPMERDEEDREETLKMDIHASAQSAEHIIPLPGSSDSDFAPAMSTAVESLLADSPSYAAEPWQQRPRFIIPATNPPTGFALGSVSTVTDVNRTALQRGAVVSSAEGSSSLQIAKEEPEAVSTERLPQTPREQTDEANIPSSPLTDVLSVSDASDYGEQGLPAGSELLNADTTRSSDGVVKPDGGVDHELNNTAVHLEPNMTISKDPDGVAVIEELDSPATRRAKHLRKKALSTNRPISSKSAAGTAGPPDEAAETAVGVSAGPRVQSPEPTLQLLNKNGKIYIEGGTLVWAKIPSYPWWPAVVFEADDPTIPLNIIKNYQKERKKQRKGDNLFFVRFFDKSMSWNFASLNCLKSLGDSRSLDERIQKRQKYKTRSLREECLAAYKQACAELDNSEEGKELANEENSKSGPAAEKPTRSARKR
ncbi:hypothetical protein FISHEDRAFT_70398 [Fistulina hepatica ATCC 64428]|uniref:PWWP domain-containing protein n=1 Tax=Fistulina hepatica ATCC 64428 TaxID=1128425 RepID=A0A0D7AJG8_9AGAR|nr:hypothetical protein FISHEDRAFT_70398 [Fistulina hepatica ATCC 64428]